MKTQSNPKDCLAAALRLLTRRDHSRWELTRKLIDRGFSQGQIKSAVSQCLHLNYLDDERYATGYTRQLQRKGYGRHRIQQMLTAKGLNFQIIADCLEACCPDKVQIQGCRQAMLKKLKSGQPMEDTAEAKARLYRFLFRRGFSPAIIRQVMEEGLD